MSLEEVTIKGGHVLRTVHYVIRKRQLSVDGPRAPRRRDLQEIEQGEGSRGTTTIAYSLLPIMRFWRSGHRYVVVYGLFKINIEAIFTNVYPLSSASRAISAASEHTSQKCA